MSTPETPLTPPEPVPAPVEPVAPVEPAPPAPPTPSPRTGPSDSYSSVPWFARRNAGAGLWEFGVTMDGVDVVLFTKKLGGVDDDLREAFQPGFKAQRAELYLRERLGF